MAARAFTGGTTLDNYADLPIAFKQHFEELEDFLGEVDGKETVLSTGDDSFIDDGTIDAEDAIKAFNGLIAEIRQLVGTGSGG